MFEWSGLTLCFDGCVYCYILIFCTGDIKQNSFIFRYFLLYIVSGFNVLIKFKNKMNFCQNGMKLVKEAKHEHLQEYNVR